MKSTRRVFVAALIAAATAGAALHAQEKASSTLLTTEHYLDWERVSDAQISPDGSRIVYTREHVNKLEDKWEQETWMLKSDGSEHRFLVKGSSGRWASCANGASDLLGSRLPRRPPPAATAKD